MKTPTCRLNIPSQSQMIDCISIHCIEIVKDVFFLENDLTLKSVQILSDLFWMGDVAACLYVNKEVVIRLVEALLRGVYSKLAGFSSNLSALVDGKAVFIELVQSDALDEILTQKAVGKYRQWWISVLYYNHQSEHCTSSELHAFCSDVNFRQNILHEEY